MASYQVQATNYMVPMPSAIRYGRIVEGNLNELSNIDGPFLDPELERKINRMRVTRHSVVNSRKRKKKGRKR